MYVIQLRAVRDPYLEHLSHKCFALINKCHNVLVKHAIHLLNRLDHDKYYQSLLSEYRRLKNKKADTKEFSDKMNEYRDSIGLSKSGLEKYIKVWQKRYAKNISSHQAQKEVSRVMAGVNKVIFD